MTGEHPSEDRVDDGLAPGVDSPTWLGHQFALHPLDQRGRLRDASPRTAWRRLIVLLIARRDVQAGLFLGRLARKRRLPRA